MTSKLIVCTMAKKPFETFCFDNLIFLIAILVSIWSGSYFVEVTLLLLCTAIILFKYAKFMFGITFRLMDYLKISF
jgi:ACR3 family arsenite efflux pump ArsB